MLGYDPAEVTRVLIEGTWADNRNRAEVLLVATPILLMAIGYCVSFRTSWNIGGEGQYVIGAVAATWVALLWTQSSPTAIAIGLTLLAGTVAGSIWVWIAAIIKVKWHRNEAFSTLMLTLIAVNLATYVYSGPLRSSQGGFPRTDRIPENVVMPVLITDTRLHVGFVLALVLVAVVYVVLSKTTWGYKLLAVGQNQWAARYAGMAVNRIVVASMMFAGATAGLAGAMQTCTIARRLDSGVSVGYGNLAIVVALIANKNPVLAVPFAIVVATMASGSKYLQISLGVSDFLTQVVTYVVLLVFIVMQNQVAFWQEIWSLKWARQVQLLQED